LICSSRSWLHVGFEKVFKSGSLGSLTIYASVGRGSSFVISHLAISYDKSIVGEYGDAKWWFAGTLANRRIEKFNSIGF